MGVSYVENIFYNNWDFLVMGSVAAPELNPLLKMQKPHNLENAKKSKLVPIIFSIYLKSTWDFVKFTVFVAFMPL